MDALVSPEDKLQSVLEGVSKLIVFNGKEFGLIVVDCVDNEEEPVIYPERVPLRYTSDEIADEGDVAEESDGTRESSPIVETKNRDARRTDRNLITEELRITMYAPSSLVLGQSIVFPCFLASPC